MPKPRKGENKDDFISRCMSSEEAKNDFPDQDQRLAVCNSFWDQRNNEGSMLVTLTVKADTAAIRHEELAGVDHLVVPVVVLVEGVLHPLNSQMPELALADEFAKRPDSWNGSPIVLNHPKNERGHLISANAPDVFEAEIFGQLFNTVRDDNKLKSEMWINLERVAELERQGVIERLKSGELVEVSAGFFQDLEMTNGQFDGERFEGIWRNVTPDHLAILSEEKTGACSVEDGAGAPRVNEAAMKDSKNLSGFSKLVSKFADVFHFRAGEHLSDVDTRAALEAALVQQEGFFFVLAVFEDSFVYDDFSGSLLQRSFEIAEDGTVSLGDDISEVRPETSFVPVKVNEEDSSMKDREERVNTLIANEASPFTEDDKPFLSALSDERFEKFEAPASEPTPVSDEEDEEKKKAAAEAAAAAVAADATTTLAPDATPSSAPEAESAPATMESYMKSAPKALQGPLAEMASDYEAHKKALIKTLIGNDRCDYDETELRGMEIPMLKKLARLSGSDDNFAGQGTVRTNAQGSENPFMAPKAPEAFPIAKAS